MGVEPTLSTHKKWVIWGMDAQLSTWHEPRKLLCWMSCCLIQGISTTKVMLQGFDVDCGFHLGEGVTHKTTALISVIVKSSL